MASRTPSPNGEALFMSLHVTLTVLANTDVLCAMVGAFKVLVWFMGRRESQERTFIWSDGNPPCLRTSGFWLG